MKMKALNDGPVLGIMIISDYLRFEAWLLKSPCTQYMYQRRCQQIQRSSHTLGSGSDLFLEKLRTLHDFAHARHVRRLTALQPPYLNLQHFGIHFESMFHSTELYRPLRFISQIPFGESQMKRL